MTTNTYRKMRAIEADAMGYKVDRFDLEIDAPGNEYTPWDGSGPYWVPESSLQTEHLKSHHTLTPSPPLNRNPRG